MLLLLLLMVFSCISRQHPPVAHCPEWLVVPTVRCSPVWMRGNSHGLLVLTLRENTCQVVDKRVLFYVVVDLFLSAGSAQRNWTTFVHFCLRFQMFKRLMRSAQCLVESLCLSDGVQLFLSLFCVCFTLTRNCQIPSLSLLLEKIPTKLLRALWSVLVRVLQMFLKSTFVGFAQTSFSSVKIT